MVPSTAQRIAIVSNTSWYVYIFRRSFIEKLVQQGFTVYVIAPKDKFVTELEALGAHFIEVQNMQNKGINPIKDLRLMWELRSIFTKHKINSALFFTPKANIFGSIACKFCRTKSIVTVNGLGFVFSDEQPAWVRFIVKMLYKFSFSGVKGIVFQNTEDRDYFLQHSLIHASQPIFHVRGSGVNVHEFNKKRQFNPGTELHFLLSARMIREKGINEYVQAATTLKKEYPLTKYILIGLEADNPSAIPMDVIHDLHTKGVLEHRGSSYDMNATMNEVDVLVLPSYYREGVPRVLLEGMAKGLPLITTDNVGCRETVVDGYNGYLIPVQDAGSLTSAMRKMIELNPQSFALMSNNSRLKAESEFNEDANHDVYLKIINTA